jgi:putative sigma-54 modulation protein
MQIIITARNFDISDTVKSYIEKKVRKLEKLYSRIYSCEVILEEEKERKNAEILLYLKRTKLVAKESSTDIYASIDSAIDKIKKQLRRYSDKISSKRKRAVLQRIMNPIKRRPPGSSFTGAEGMSSIVKTDTFADKPMLPEEAKLELEMSGMDFIMFRNADTGQSNVLYRRNSGNLGLIEPKS